MITSTKKSSMLSILFCVVLALAVSIVKADSTIILPTDKNLLFVGRWDRRDPTVYHSHWTGAYIRTRFTGTSVGVNLADGLGLAVSIDGEVFRPYDGVQGLNILNIAPLASGTHTLLVGSILGGEMQVQSVVLDAGAKVMPPAPRPLIEFIGDSITWGSGPDKMWSANYAWDTAESLNCDHTQVAQSARALTTGYGCASDKAALDTQYFKLKNFGYMNDNPQIYWDFSTYTPQIVVINLGQNDACGNEPDDVFTASYVKFVKNIRAKFPVAQIVAVRMFGGGHFGDDTKNAVAMLNADGDTRVHFIDTEGWLEKADFRDGVHPNDVGHLKAAARLAPLLIPFLPKAAADQLTGPIGDPTHSAALPKAIQDAYIRGERNITITPGTYLLPSTGKPLILLNNWHDATINAPHVSLIDDTKTSSDQLFFLTNCVNTTIAGPLLSQTTINAYQGKVVATGKDDQGNYTANWKPSAGYPVPPDGTKELWINVVDGKTRLMKIDVGDYYHAQLDPPIDGVYRFHLGSSPLRFGVGDWIVARYGDNPNKVFLDNDTNCTIEDVTMTRNGFAPIFESGGSGNHILRVHWTLGPRPAGATEDPIVTNAADGIHCANSNPGPDIEDCTFDGVFLDDCIAIHGNYQNVISVNGSTITVQNGYGFPRLNEPLRIEDSNGFYVQANVTALKDNGDKTTTLTLDTTVPIPLDAGVSNPLHDGSGYKIIGCKLGNTRSRGIICKADNGLIENNTITHSGCAIQIGPEWPSESDYVKNVNIVGNTIEDNGDGIVLTGHGAIENSNVTIKNNKLISNYGRYIVLQWTDGGNISDNIFASPLDWLWGRKPNPAIEISNSKNVAVSGNQYRTPSAFASPVVTVGDNVTGLTQDTSP